MQLFMSVSFGNELTLFGTLLSEHDINMSKPKHLISNKRVIKLQIQFFFLMTITEDVLSESLF